MFTSLRGGPLVQKAALLSEYGLLIFAAIYLAGNQLLDTPLSSGIINNLLWLLRP